MIWIVILVIGILGLWLDCGGMSWLFVVIGAGGFGIKLWKDEVDRKRTMKPPKKQLQLVEMPDDAHDAVAAFARLAHRTYSVIQQMDPERDKYFYQIVIKLNLGADDKTSKANFSFEFDWNMDGFHENFGYKLGDGFTVKDDVVSYKSDHVRNLYSWVGAAALESKQTGRPFDKHHAEMSAKGIVATVVNSCPVAYVHTKYATEDEFYVLFKFK